MSGVTLGERYGLGYPVPLDALCLSHADPVADGGQGLERGAAALLVVQRAILDGVAVCYLPEQIAKGLGDRLRHRYGTVGEDLQRCILVEGHALDCTLS